MNLSRKKIALCPECNLPKMMSTQQPRCQECRTTFDKARADRRNEDRKQMRKAGLFTHRQVKPKPFKVDKESFYEASCYGSFAVRV